MTEGVIVVSAAADAKHAAALVSLKGTGQGPQGPIESPVRPQEEIYLPGGGRGHYPVDTLALAVTDPSDISVEATPGEIVLAPGASAAVDVTITRNPRYEQGVNLAVVLQHLGGVHGNPLPPGVTVKEAGSKTLLGPKETKGKIILQASPAAACLRKSPDRRDGACLDQLRRQNSICERADPGVGASQVGQRFVTNLDRLAGFAAAALAAQANRSLTTFPCTSVSRKSRPA